MIPKRLIERAIIALASEGILPESKNGKFKFHVKQQWGGPWAYAKYSNKNCIFWQSFVYKLISRRLPKGRRFIPTECMNCYKVVVRPETYEELLTLKKICFKMNLPGKVGIEKRAVVDALYSGYWYCNGKEEGFERLKQVRFALLGTKMTAFLKRGCTEYEVEFGPSDKWTPVRGQKAIEQKAVEMVEIDNPKYLQPIADIDYIMRGWKEFAETCGPDYVPSHNYVTYEL